MVNIHSSQGMYSIASKDKIGSFKFMEAGYSQSLSYKLALKIAFSMDSHTNLENQPPRGAD